MPESGASSIHKALATLQASQPSVFGADVHRFKLNAPLDEARITSFEQEHQIGLPEDYKHFLTTIADGGAGPYYGILPLGRIDHAYETRVWTAEDVGLLSATFLLENAWNDLTARPAAPLLDQDEFMYWEQMKVFETSYWSTALVNGAIPICHQGCAIRTLLIVTGPQAGFLWLDRRSEYAGIEPVKLIDGSPARFFDWYNEWLTNCLVKPISALMP